MTIQRHTLAALTVTLVASLFFSATHADPRKTHVDRATRYLAQANSSVEQRFIDKRRQPQQQQSYQPRISRDQAAAIAREQTGGRVLRVQLQGKSYRVKLLLSGERVKTVRVDADSGKLN